jgi:hypothetical protein
VIAIYESTYRGGHLPMMYSPSAYGITPPAVDRASDSNCDFVHAFTSISNN